MKLRNPVNFVLFLLLLTFVLPVQAAYVAASETPVHAPVVPENGHEQQLLSRLENIKKMDRSEMTKLERKAIRKEVVSIRKELKKISGGIYLSVGAVIIIVLLILLL